MNVNIFAKNKYAKYMKKIIFNGATSLFLAGLIGKLFGAIYRLPLSNLLGAEGMGLYQMAFPIYSFLLTFITGGVSVYLTKKIAKHRANNDVLLINKEFYLAKRTTFIYGLVVFLFLILFAYPLSLLQGNSDSVLGYIAISLGVVFACNLSAYRGYFQGYGNMMPTATSQLLEQFVKLVLGLVFAGVFVKYGTIYGVLGALVGISLSEVFTYVYFKFKIKNEKNIFNPSLILNDYKQFIKGVWPLSLTCMILPLSNVIDSFLIINLLSNTGFSLVFATSMYGIESGMILPLINMPNILISAIAVATMPNLSYKLAKNEDVSKDINNMLKLALMFILPCMIGLSMFAEEILRLIFTSLTTSQVFIASNLLRLSVVEMFFLCFVTITNSILQSVNKEKVPLKNLTYFLIIKTILILILIPVKGINIYGVPIASIFAYFTCATLNILYLKKHLKIRLNFKQIIVPIFSSILILFFILIIKNFTAVSTLTLLTTIALCVVIYFLSMIIFKELSFKDIKNILQSKQK